MSDFGTRGHRPMPRPDASRERPNLASECKMTIWSREKIDAHWSTYPAPNAEASTLLGSNPEYRAKIRETMERVSRSNTKGDLKEVELEKIGGGKKTLSRDNLILHYQAGMRHTEIGMAYRIKPGAIKKAAEELKIQWSLYPQFQSRRQK